MNYRPPQHFLYFLPLPHGQGSLRPTVMAPPEAGSSFDTAADAARTDCSETFGFGRGC